MNDNDIFAFPFCIANNFFNIRDVSECGTEGGPLRKINSPPKVWNGGGGGRVAGGLYRKQLHRRCKQ
jgi:hypothetical protein